jgi:hypothetical protein
MPTVTTTASRIAISANLISSPSGLAFLNESQFYVLATRSLRPAALLGVREAAPAEEKRLTGEAMLLMTLERNGHENCRTDQRVLSQFANFGDKSSA